MHSNTLLPVLVLALFSASGLCQDVVDSADAVCSNVSLGVRPHPTNCRQYYVCVLFTGSVHQCGFNFVFDPRVSFCVHSSMYQCPNAPEPTTSAPTEEPSTTNVPELTSTVPSTPSVCPETSWESLFCRNAVSPLVRNPFNCTQYINCQLDRPSNRECPPEQIFSLPYQDCFPGDTGRCLLEPIEPKFCESRTNGNYPHPYRCNRFVTCFQNSTRVESCPPYYVFGQPAGPCVRGDVLKCSSLLSEV